MNAIIIVRFVFDYCSVIRQILSDCVAAFDCLSGYFIIPSTDHQLATENSQCNGMNGKKCEKL
jgi:hypothetical protein